MFEKSREFTGIELTGRGRVPVFEWLPTLLCLRRNVSTKARLERRRSAALVTTSHSSIPNHIWGWPLVLGDLQLLARSLAASESDPFRPSWFEVLHLTRRLLNESKQHELWTSQRRCSSAALLSKHVRLARELQSEPRPCFSPPNP